MTLNTIGKATLVVSALAIGNAISVAQADERYPHTEPGYSSAGSAPAKTATGKRGRIAAQPVASFAFAGGTVAEARRYIGTNPTGKRSLWCARFMNLVLERSGKQGTGSDMARSFTSAGTRVSGPQVGAIAVMSRGRGGGHVGIVSGIDADGNPIVISGNYQGRVAETTIPRGRIHTYVML